MKRISRIFWLAIATLLASITQAFPPAPHHTFFGMVRDEFGTPLTATNVLIILETSAGVTVKTKISTGSEAGVNYTLNVPMDAGLTSDLYQPTAMQPLAPFKFKVKISNTTYLPIEMSGDFSHLGAPGQSTRLNLTLGEDLDGDGIPDAWERALISRTGGNRTIRDINAAEDSDGDGLSNMDEYVAGTYAFDPANGFALKIVALNGTAPHLEFTALRGHTYTIFGSIDFSSWEPLEFRLAGQGGEAPYLDGYFAPDVRPIRAELRPERAAAGYKFFKLMVQ